MAKSNYDITIAYRIYPKVSKETAIYSDNKLLLSEFCLYSFAKSLKNINAKIYVILDGCPPEYYELFDKYLSSFDFELIHTDGIGNAKTFELQMELLLNQNYSDVIYFAEDDYFYLDNAFSLMLDYINSEKVGFITPYDHPDYYSLKLHDTKYFVDFDKVHWRSALSTTMTFMTRIDTLKNNRTVFDSYIKNNSDASLWASITGNEFRSITYILKNVLKDKTNFKYFLKSYYYNPLKTLFGKKYNLMVPIPALGVHMEKKYLSNGVDWGLYFDNVIQEINNN